MFMNMFIGRLDGMGWDGGSRGFDPAPRARQVWPGLASDLVESQG